MGGLLTENTPARPASPTTQEVAGSSKPSSAFRSRWRTPLLLAAAGLLGAALIAFFYALSWHAFVGNSDDANAVLAGNSMAHGNVLLHGWSLASDTYWPVDIGVYGLYSLFYPVSSASLHAVPAILFAGIAVVATAFAGMAGRGSSRILGGATTFIILALPVPLGAFILLQGQQHVGTVLLCLVAFVLLDSTWSSPRWWVGTGVLAAAALGDPLSYAFGVAAVAAAGVISGIRKRDLKAIGPGVSAAGLALLIAWAGHHALWHLGQHRWPHPSSAPARLFTGNAGSVPRYLFNFLGVGSHAGISRPAQAVHIVGLIAVGCGVLAALASILGALRPARGAQAGNVADAAYASRAGRATESRWVDDVLLVGFWGSVGAFVITTTDHHDLSALRFLLPAVVFGATLAGRALARWQPALRLSRPLAWSAVVLVALAYVSGPAATLRKPEAPPSPLTTWLVRHHLSIGVGPYWDASYFTVESGQAVRIKPVIEFEGRLHALDFYADHKWFTGPDRNAQPAATFFVDEPAAPWGGVSDTVAKATFGEPAETVNLGQFEILIWNGNILARLPT